MKDRVIKQMGSILFFSFFMTIFFLWGTVDLLVKKAQAGEYKFGFSTSISEEYDDNIGLDEDDEDDFITYLTPIFSLSYLGKQHNLDFTYNPMLEFYADHSNENDINHNATLLLNSQLTPKLNLLMTDALIFTRGQDIAQEELRVRQGSVRSYASDRLNNFFNTTLSYQIFKTINLHGGFSYNFEDYDESELVDNEEYIYELGIDNQLTGRDTISLNYSYRRLLYEEVPIPSEGGPFELEDDTDVQSITIGERHQFLRELLFDISAGIAFVDEENEDEENEWIARMNITKEFKTASIGILFSRNISDSDGVGGTSVNQIFSFTGRKNFSRYLIGNFTAYFSTEESTSSEILIEDGVARKVKVDNEDWGVIFETNYQFSKKLTGRFSYSYIKQDSKSLIEGDTENFRGIVGLSYQLRPNWSTFCSYNYYQQNALDPEMGEEDIENNSFTIGTEITWF
jgi:predicted porin